MTITNETIIKAAKAAGLAVVQDEYDIGKRLLNVGMFVPMVQAPVFDPLHNDTDNALIRRGAEIDVVWSSSTVVAIAWGDGEYRELRSIHKTLFTKENPAQAEREAVILCAAAKWDAQGEKA